MSRTRHREKTARSYMHCPDGHRCDYCGGVARHDRREAIAKAVEREIDEEDWFDISARKEYDEIE